MPNRSTKIALFVVVFGHLPKQPADLTDLPSALLKLEEILNSVEDIHKWVHDNNDAANSKYKKDADLTWKEQVFEVGDFVIIQIHCGRFSVRSYFKLKNRNFGPCQILKKISDMVHLLEEFNMTPTFNVGDLIKYYPPLAVEVSHSRSNEPDVGSRPPCI